MGHNTEIKEFKTDLCAQPKSWFLMIFNFGRSLTRCTWAVFLILNCTCNSSWSARSWGGQNPFAGLVLQPVFLLLIRTVSTVVSLDSAGKQTNKTCEISCLESSWQIHCHIFCCLLSYSSIRKTQSNVFKLKMHETNDDGQRALIRTRVCEVSSWPPCLVF